MRLRLLFLFVLVVVFAAPLASAGITYQPSALPEVGFSYDSAEYLFRLTYRDYYLNIQPYAVYDGQAYTLRQIVPFLRGHYPEVSYRQAVQVFAEYHRWGFYLERLPAEVSAKLEEVGYRLVDTNIPRAWFEVEADPMLNVSRVTIGGRFTLDFSDLEARYDVSIDAEGVHVTGITGLTDLDLDPITYSAPTITVTGTNAGAPWTFLDIWNADVAGGWGVVANNNGTGRQFEFNAKIVIGDGATTTTFTDTAKQVVFTNVRAGTGEMCIRVRVGATLTLGTLSGGLPCRGCGFVFIQPSTATYGWGLKTEGTTYLYGCSFHGVNAESWVNANRVYSSHFTDLSYLYIIDVVCDIQNVVLSGTYGIRRPLASTTTSNLIITANSRLIYLQTTSGILNNVYISDLPLASDLIKVDSTGAFDHYLTDIQWKDDWEFSWSGVNTGEVYRQYTFNLNVTGLDGAPIGANVTLTRADGTVAFTALTYANGTIPEQTVTRGYYTQPTGNTLNDYGPFTLTVEADGYLPYEMVNINVNYPVNWSISLTALSLGLEFFSFIMVACAALYYGYTCGDADRSMVSFMFGFLFWLATMVQWFVDQATSPVIILGWVYVFPILLCVYEILMRATAQLDAGTKVNPFE